MTEHMTEITLRLTAEDRHRLRSVVEYYAEGRFGVTIGEQDALLIALADFAQRCRPDRVINDCGLTETERAEGRRRQKREQQTP